MIGHGFLSSMRCQERDDASYCARCGEPFEGGRASDHLPSKTGREGRETGEAGERRVRGEDGHRLAQLGSPLRPPHRRGNISPGLLVPRLVGQLGPALAPPGHRIRTLHSVERVEGQGGVPEALLSHSRSQFCISVPDLVRSQSRRHGWAPLRDAHSISKDISSSPFFALNLVLVILRGPISPVVLVCSLLHALTFQPGRLKTLSLLIEAGRGKRS